MTAATILVADDDAAIRTVLNQALSRAGYDVRITSNAATLWRWISAGDGDMRGLGNGGRLETNTSKRHIKDTTSEGHDAPPDFDNGKGAMIRILLPRGADTAAFKTMKVEADGV